MKNIAFLAGLAVVVYFFMQKKKVTYPVQPETAQTLKKVDLWKSSGGGSSFPAVTPTPPVVQNLPVTQNPSISFEPVKTIGGADFAPVTIVIPTNQVSGGGSYSSGSYSGGGTSNSYDYSGPTSSGKALNLEVAAQFSQLDKLPKNPFR